MAVKEEYWITKDGKTIAIGDMELSHLRNVLRMLIREDRIVKTNNDDSSYMIDEYNSYSGSAEWWKE